MRILDCVCLLFHLLGMRVHQFLLDIKGFSLMGIDHPYLVAGNGCVDVRFNSDMRKKLISFGILGTNDHHCDVNDGVLQVRNRWWLS